MNPSTITKVWRPIKAVLWTALAIFVLVVRDVFVHNLNYFVGGIMIIYGLEAVILHLLKKKSFFKKNKFFWGVMETIVGIVVICFVHVGLPETTDYAVVCIIWALWSLLRETLEIEECVIEIGHGQPVFLSLTESIIGIVFSVLLIIEPGEHHASTHVILLFFELITTGLLFPYARLLVNYLRKKHDEKKGIPFKEEEEEE